VKYENRGISRKLSALFIYVCVAGQNTNSTAGGEKKLSGEKQQHGGKRKMKRVSARSPWGTTSERGKENHRAYRHGTKGRAILKHQRKVARGT